MSFASKMTLLFSSLLILLVLPQFGFAHGMSEAEKQIIAEGGNLRYLWIGATHMLSGYDHLAFVFGIIFFLTRVKDIIKFITAFTIGHSITLIWATFNAIQVNYFLIDAFIALSVCYIAFVNLGGFKKYLNIKPPNMLVMITALGLIHGLGLSTRLQELPLSEDQLLMNIISFNVGIEFGQISALLLMLALITVFRKSSSFPAFSRVTNMGLMLMGGYLFLMQMHGYEHTQHASEYSSSQQQSNNASIAAPSQVDWMHTTTVVIPARGNKEYKFNIAIGKSLEYSWQTDGEALFFEFHGEPENDTTGYFKSYKKATSTQSSGMLTTPFTGTHGWYWENKTASPVTITLKSKGEYQRLDLDGELDQFEEEMEEDDVEIDLSSDDPLE